MLLRPGERKPFACTSIVFLGGLALVAFTALLLGACGGGAACAATRAPNNAETPTPTTVTLQIFAANSLEKALLEVQDLYSSRYPQVVFKDTQFKGSGDLVAQLQGGAPADILITASRSLMDTALADGLIDKNTRRDMFTNELVVIKQEGSAVTLNSLAELTSDSLTKIAIGDADAVPAGRYANQSLYSAGLYSDQSGRGGRYLGGLDTKTILQSSVGNVAKTVSTGDVQIGFVFSSDLLRFEGIEQLFVVPEDAHEAIVYPGAIITGSANTLEATRFLAFCQSDPNALAIWSHYGFTLPLAEQGAQATTAQTRPSALQAPESAGTSENFLVGMDYRPFWVSLKTSLTALLFVFVLGLAAARLTLRAPNRAKDLLDALFTIPLVLPPTVIGFLLLVAFGNSTAFGRWLVDHGIALVFSWPAAVIAATVVAFPLMYRTVRGAFEAQDPEMLDAARTLGWQESRIFFKLMLPLAWPSIAAGTVLAFARAMGEFGATLFVAGNFAGVTQTMPLAIYFEWMGGRTDAAVFWVVVVILISFVVILFINLYARHTQKFRLGAAREQKDNPFE
ncbi:MAG: molybdate ABC transporter permease subunit [Coriobacteriales bacterium]|nr:molybdate ABC transporter permease subunit [Coriobacteriales bacterium]